MISTGIKVESIASYNHLGNNDGKNLSEQKQFKSKELSKSGVINDIVRSNSILYKENEGPDQTVVIQYIPYSSDTKRAIDEYTASIFMNGEYILSSYNLCEDSLLAAPIIIDLIILSEIMSRVKINVIKNNVKIPINYSVLELLSLFFKSPQSEKPINSFYIQKQAITGFLRTIAGISEVPDWQRILNY